MGKNKKSLGHVELTLCSLGICAAEVMRGSCLSRVGRYFSCRAVIGGRIETAVTKVKGF